MPSLLDREVGSAAKDAFGHRHYAEALKSLIENEKHKPPYSIGLLGNWGTGKSTIKKLYLNGLKEDAESDSKGKKRSEKISPITFNAWRFGGSDIKRALLRHIYLELGGNERSLRDALFRQIERSSSEDKTGWEIVRDIAASLGWPLLLVTLAASAVALVVWLIAETMGAGEISSSLIGVAAFYFSGYVLKGYIESGIPFVRFDNPVNRIELPLATAEEYEDLLLEQIKSFVQGEGADCERLVVFVDDLDRLSAREMVDGLDAIRTFLDLPDSKLPDDLGVIFVISCDEARVARAIERKWANGSDLPGAVFSFEDARRYLNRMFQFRLEIPRFPKRDMRNYARQRFKSELKEVAEDINQSETSLESVVTRLMHVDVESPRNAIQIINAFAQSWWIAKKREYEGPGSNRAGGLREGVVTSHPESLAALSVLRVDYPDFYDELQGHSDLIQRFVQVFIRDSALQKQPEAIRDALGRFAADENGTKVKDEYKGLLRYISGLQGIRWPDSLRPLLLLTQDPVTRDLGESEIRVREELISANHQGVLEALGRGADDKEFSQKEVEILHNVIEELHRRDAIRRDNAASVLANLCRRIPDDGMGRKLYTFLSSRLQRSGDLRYRLGIGKIKKFLDRLRPDEQRTIASRLVDDIIKVGADSEAEIDFMTQDLETPSLNEARDIVDAALPVILDVRRNCGLEDKEDEKLLKWLRANRPVRVSGDKDELPFPKLEEWVQAYEDSLLPDLESDYIRLLAQYLRTERSPTFDLDEALRKSRDVFDRMVQAGSESRRDLGSVLTSFVSVSNGAAVKQAYSFVIQTSHQFDQATVSSFIEAFAGRLQKREKDENWRISDQWRSDLEALLQLVDSQNDIEDEAAKEALKDLAIELGRVTSEGERAEQKARYSTEIIDRLLGFAPEQANQAISNWTDRVLDDLPVQARKWIGGNLERVSSDQRASLIDHLNQTVRDTNISQEIAERYNEFTAEVTREGACTEEVRGHFGNIYNYLKRNSNQQYFVGQLFPALSQVIKYGPKDKAGQMIDQLFNQSQNNHPLHGVLHSSMADYWPNNVNEYESYDPKKYFNYGSGYINKYANGEEASEVLYSMRKIAKHGLVDESHHKTIIDAACKIWGYDKNAATDAIQAYSSLPSDTNQVSDLIESVNTDSEDDIEALKTAWNKFSTLTSADQDYKVLVRLLNKQAENSPEAPDLGVNLWTSSDGVSAEELLRRTALSEELNDEQRKRVWLEIERRAEALGSKFFLDLLPSYFRLSESLQAQQEALSSKSKTEISALFDAREEEQELALTLVKSLQVASTTNLKRKLARWVGELEAPSHLITQLDQDLSPQDKEFLGEQVASYET
jgi:hypothetical protein